MGPGMMYGYGVQGLPFFGGWGTGITMGLGVVMMLAFWGVIIVGIALLVRALTRPESTSFAAEQDPFTILQRRYAGGEIDEPTYQRMRRELLGSDATPPTELHRAS